MQTRTAIRGMAVLAALGLLAGCAAHQASYRPSDASTYAMGYRATVYDVSLDNQRLGIVKVYSEGGEPLPAGGSQGVINVRLRVRNFSDGPMSLDLSKCDIEVDSDSGRQVIQQPLSKTGVEPIPPGGIGQISLLYPLQGGLQPDQVNGFDFDWTINTEKGIYANTTPFVQRVVQDVYVYYPLYSGWWGYPSWGWGWGWDGRGWGAWGDGGRHWGERGGGDGGRGGGAWGGGRGDGGRGDGGRGGSRGRGGRGR